MPGLSGKPHTASWRIRCAPASCAMLWSFLGWLSFKLARVLWVAAAVLMLGWLVYLTIRESLADTTLERIFMLLLPMIALFRIAKQNSTSAGVSDLFAGGLLAIALISMLAPASLFTFPPSWNWLAMTVQVTVWFMILIFLVRRARVEKNRPTLTEQTQRVCIQDVIS